MRKKKKENTKFSSISGSFISQEVHQYHHTSIEIPQQRKKVTHKRNALHFFFSLSLLVNMSTKNNFSNFLRIIKHLLNFFFY